jgi:HNH endonuclease
MQQFQAWGLELFCFFDGRGLCGFGFIPIIARTVASRRLAVSSSL